MNKGYIKEKMNKNSTEEIKINGKLLAQKMKFEPIGCKTSN